MALKAYLQTIDGLSDELKTHYKPSEAEGGGFVLDTEGVEDVSGLKSALDHERKNNAETKKFYAQHKDYDFSQLAELEKEHKKKLEAAAGDSEKLQNLKDTYEGEKNQLIQLQEDEKNQWSEEKASMDKTINKLMVTDELTKELAKVAVDSDSIELLRMAAESQFEVVINDAGAREVRVKKDGGGHEITSGGSYKNIQARVAEMANETKYARLVKGEGNSGSGAHQQESGGAGGVKNPWSKDNFNLTEQGKITKQNPVLAKQMQATK